MTKVFLIIMGILLLASGTEASFWRSVVQNTPQKATVTLFSPNKFQGGRRSCLVLQAITPGSRDGSCDVRYGALYVGDDLDWFESSAGEWNRSVIKDLGLLNWDQAFTVPVVKPFPKLKPGEQRQITVDASGADGADGAPGARGQDGADADGVVRSRSTDQSAQVLVIRAAPSKPRRDGKPKVDPVFVKAAVGHIYVIHVVDDRRDFYALFRVEALERGDNCTISWQLVQAPEASANKPRR